MTTTSNEDKDRASVENEHLCQDCLKAVNESVQIDNGRCKCGGDLCDCFGCKKTIQLLRNGHRDAKTLQIQRDIKSWTPENGLVIE